MIDKKKKEIAELRSFILGYMNYVPSQTSSQISFSKGNKYFTLNDLESMSEIKFLKRLSE